MALSTVLQQCYKHMLKSSCVNVTPRKYKAHNLTFAGRFRDLKFRKQL